MESELFGVDSERLRNEFNRYVYTVFMSVRQGSEWRDNSSDWRAMRMRAPSLVRGMFFVITPASVLGDQSCHLQNVRITFK